DVLPQLEGVGQTVLRDVPAGGEVTGELDTVRLVLEQRVVDVASNKELLVRRGEVRIERALVRLEDDGQGVFAARCGGGWLGGSLGRRSRGGGGSGCRGSGRGRGWRLGRA